MGKTQGRFDGLPIATDASADLQQLGTIPFVTEEDGGIRIVLVTTRGSGRWTIPKGNPIAGLAPHKAAAREALEEAAHEFHPEALVGVYLSRYQSNHSNLDVTYLRFAFAGELGVSHQRPLDDGILRTMWMSHAEIEATQDRHRSPLVLKCVEDYLAGQRFPLSLIYSHPSIQLVPHG